MTHVITANVLQTTVDAECYKFETLHAMQKLMQVSCRSGIDSSDDRRLNARRKQMAMSETGRPSRWASAHILVWIYLRPPPEVPLQRLFGAGW